MDIYNDLNNGSKYVKAWAPTQPDDTVSSKSTEEKIKNKIVSRTKSPQSPRCKLGTRRSLPILNEKIVLKIPSNYRPLKITRDKLIEMLKYCADNQVYSPPDIPSPYWGRYFFYLNKFLPSPGYEESPEWINDISNILKGST